MVFGFRKSFGYRLSPTGPMQVGSVITGDSNFAISWGDNTAENGNVVVEVISEDEDVFQGSLSINHTYAAHNDSGAPWEIVYNNCCRLSRNAANPRTHHANHPDAWWYMSLEVDLWADGDAGNIYSPDVTTLPLVYLPLSTTSSFFVGGYDCGASARGGP
jgi:hypothetical protein